MVWFHTVATIAPSLIILFTVYLMWETIKIVPQLAVFVFLFSLLPLTAQLCMWGYRYRQTQHGHAGRVMPPHPFGLVLLLALLLVIPLKPVGEWLAKQVPALCELAAEEQVMTTRPESPTRKASFSVQINGWGNHRSFGFNGGIIVYTGRRRFEDLYFDLPRRRGHWTNSYTTFFPLTREVVSEYVRGSDDFPHAEAEAITDQLWDALNRYAEKRNLPPMIDYFHSGEEPRIVSYVPSLTIYVSTCFLSILPLAVVSWLLARRYYRLVLHAKGKRLPNWGFQ